LKDVDMEGMEGPISQVGLGGEVEDRRIVHEEVVSMVGV